MFIKHLASPICTQFISYDPTMKINIRKIDIKIDLKTSDFGPAMGLLCAAQKYILPDLDTKCLQYAIRTISVQSIHLE